MNARPIPLVDRKTMVIVRDGYFIKCEIRQRPEDNTLYCVSIEATWGNEVPAGREFVLRDHEPRLALGILKGQIVP